MLVPQSVRPLPRVPLNQGDPPCLSPAWPPGPRQGWAAGSDRFRLLVLRVSRTFLDQLRPQLLRPWIPNSTRCLHFPSSLGAFPAACTPRFSDFSRLFTAHLFRPWTPSSARSIGVGPRRSWGVISLPHRFTGH